jgi:hypothetical protein
VSSGGAAVFYAAENFCAAKFSPAGSIHHQDSHH